MKKLRLDYSDPAIVRVPRASSPFGKATKTLRRLGYDGSLGDRTALRSFVAGGLKTGFTVTWSDGTTERGIRPLLGSSHKVELGLTEKVKTAVQHLSPATESGFNMCANASPACAAACLGHSTGHLRYDANQVVRIKKTLYMKLFPSDYFAQLVAEIRRHARLSERAGYEGAVRLDGSSDQPWDRWLDMSQLPVKVYDYTKDVNKALRSVGTSYPRTFSLDERPKSEASAGRVLAAGGTVAAVIGSTGRSTPKTAALAVQVVLRTGLMVAGKVWPALNGDLTDIRYRDPGAHIVGLTAKGGAHKDTAGFVRRVEAA